MAFRGWWTALRSKRGSSASEVDARDSARELARAAFVLAAHDRDARKSAEEVLGRGSVCRDSFGWGPPTLSWCAQVVPADLVASDTFQVTAAEVEMLLHLEAKAGQAIIVNVEPLDLAATLAALAAEGGACTRVAHLLGVTRADVSAALRDHGLDLEARTLGGIPWLLLPREHTWTEIEVVASGTTTRPGQMALDRARLLDPGVNVGDGIPFSAGCHELDAFLAKVGRVEPDPVGWLGAETLAVHRSGGIWPDYAVPADQREGLLAIVADVDGHLLQRLFADDATKSLVFRCPRSRLWGTVATLHARHARGSTWWPVVVGSETDLMNTREARAHANLRPIEEVLATATHAIVSDGRSKAMTTETPDSAGDPVWVALIPVRNSFEIPAYFQCWHNDVPSADVLVGLLARLEVQFGAVVVEYRYDTIVLGVGDLSDVAWAGLLDASAELCRVCPDLLEQGFESPAQLAMRLRSSRRWTLWWD